MYKKSLILLTLFFVSLLGASEKPLLLDNLSHANPQDYIVIRSRNEFIFFYVNNKENNILTVEEITIPVKIKNKFFKSMSWKEWFEKKCPKSASWTIFSLDLNAGKIQKFYSFTLNKGLDMNNFNDFFSKLLNLDFKHIPKNQRKVVGEGKNVPGMVSKRLWVPPVKFNNRKIKNVSFDAWKGAWPKDGSALAGKNLEIYIPQKKSNLPNYWPFWIEVKSPVIKMKLIVVDGGSALFSDNKLPFFLNDQSSTK